ncbi:MAG: hypothetical protein AAFR75_06200 [Pseudomonadota bacterium]
MSVIRLVALTAIAVSIIPHDPQKREAILINTRENVTWLLATCEREPDVCDQLNQNWRTLSDSAQRTVAMKAALVRQSIIDNSPRTETFQPPEMVLNSASQSVDHGTLANADLKPPWSGDVSP